MSETRDAHLTADIVLIGARGGVWHVLLITRRWPPYEGRWALPGGYVDHGERFADAARRELAEETGLTGITLTQVGIYDTPDRDPRGRVVSVAYTAALADLPAPTAGDDARDARWVPLAAVLADPDRLAFDHAQILHDALTRNRITNHEEDTAMGTKRTDNQDRNRSKDRDRDRDRGQVRRSEYRSPDGSFHSVNEVSGDAVVEQQTGFNFGDIYR